MKTIVQISKPDIIIEWYFYASHDAKGNFIPKKGTMYDEAIFQHKGSPREITIYDENDTKVVLSIAQFDEIVKEINNIRVKIDYLLFDD